MNLKNRWNEQGGSLLMVLIVVTISVTSFGYIITNLLPQLQNEKKKMETAINYRVFMASINDYLLHGIRERWCLNIDSKGSTDLLPSNRCKAGSAMEDVVTYPGNLERLLWNDDNIGSPQATPITLDNANRILTLNHYRFEHGLTSRKLSKEDIALPDGKMVLKVDKRTLNDMNEEHPLFIISKNVRNCVDEISIELFQVRDINNMPISSERKIGVLIEAKIDRTSFSCMASTIAKSTSYYTFYPRRLHTFSLLKYGDLDASLYNEYHGPVYVAGNLKLPRPDYNPQKSSLFYNTLTLGVFNDGSGKESGYRAGKVVNYTSSDYTFNERGHPYQSKNDNYPGFRGFLGGVRLDASEDKGFYNLFNWNSVSSGNINELESCIEEAKAFTTPSYHAGTYLAYIGHPSSADQNNIKLSFARSKRNRFDFSDEAPRIIEEPRKRENFDLSLSSFPEGVRAMGEVRFYDSSRGHTYKSEIGKGAKFELTPDMDRYGISENKISESLSNLSSEQSSSPINQSSPLYALPERQALDDAASAFRSSCENKTGALCSNFGFTPDPLCIDPACDHSDLWESYLASKEQLKGKLERLKSSLSDPSKKPKLSIGFSDLPPVNGKLIRNQTLLQTEFSEGWRDFYPLIKDQLPPLRFNVSTRHLGYGYLSIQYKIKGDEGNQVEVESQRNWFGNNNPGNSWNRAYYNTAMKTEEYPEPIFDLDCPTGMGLADWDMDMSSSTNFAWNYANTPAGVAVDTSDHENLAEVVFDDSMLEGFQETTKSVVETCIVEPNRTHVYGFYVCKRLVIKPRSLPLHMIGTFIVQTLDQPKNLTRPVYWYSVWEARANDLIMTDLKKTICPNSNDLLNKTFADYQRDPMAKARADSCSPLELVANGPNNLSWTTIDPDIGIANPGDLMTSQKTNRIQKWIIKEESRIELIR
jgi:hypothetical protein